MLSLSFSVRPLVMKEFFFSLRSYKGISRKSNGCFNKVLRIFNVSFLHSFKGFFKEVLKMIQGRFRSVQMKFPWCFNKVSSVLQKVFGVELLGVC